MSTGTMMRAIRSCFNSNNLKQIDQIRGVHIKTTCRDAKEKPKCENPCKLTVCDKIPDKPPPCPKKPCLPPIHTCPYDDPCFHCPYTPPMCPKKKDPCCKRPCCPPDNPYLFKDICCRPRHPNRIVSVQCPDVCKVKRRECCPCEVCNSPPIPVQSCRRTDCCPKALDEKYHRCILEPDPCCCPREPCCPPIDKGKKINVPCTVVRVPPACKNR